MKRIPDIQQFKRIIHIINNKVIFHDIYGLKIVRDINAQENIALQNDISSRIRFTRKKMMNMNLLDNIEKHVEFMTANTQGHIFEYASELGYDLEEFVTEYMKSDFCNQEMDSDYSMFQNEVDTACMEVILKEFSKKGITIQSDPEHHYRFCAFYTGFVYRYLQLLSSKSSKELISIIPFSKMAMNYYLDHYEYKDAIKIICEREKMNLGIVIDW